MDEPRFDPLDYVSVFDRRKWWFIVPVAVAIIAGVILVWTLPRTYDSVATVGVSSPRLAASLVGGSGESERTERLRAIQQQLLSRPVLERTVQVEGLAADGAVDAAISRIRSRVRVAPSASITPGSSANTLSPETRAQLDSYQLFYSDGSPTDAQRILNRIAHVFVEETMKARDARAEDTSAFIETQVAASEQKLQDLEARLRTAKEVYMGQLPEQTGSNLAMVEAHNRQLESTTTALRGEQDRLSSLERQIEAMEQGADVGAMAGNTPLMNSQARVLQLRGELNDARMTYTDKHPEVVRLVDELATAERAAAAERERPADDRRSVLALNPSYRQLARDRDAARFRIAELQRQQVAANNAIRQYRNRVESAPRVEQELVSLTRAYDLERAAHTSLQQKRQAAILAEQLQRTQGVEHFAVLVPASFPAAPTSPKPMRLMLMALAAGLVIGGAGVMGREYLDRSVHDARGLRDQFELPVLAEIPRIEPVVS